jgi:hypothetical protein
MTDNRIDDAESDEESPVRVLSRREKLWVVSPALIAFGGLILMLVIVLVLGRVLN